MRTLLMLLALVGFGMTGCGGADNTTPPAEVPAEDPVPAEGAPADPAATNPGPGSE